MKYLILLLAVLVTDSAIAATPITLEQATRFPRIVTMLGEYELMKNNSADGVACLKNPRIYANTIKMDGRELQVLWVGPHAYFPIADLTKTFPTEDDGCSSVQVSTYNDTKGWAEQRSNEFCESKRTKSSYRKVSFNYPKETVRLLTKKNGRTEMSCTWKKLD